MPLSDDDLDRIGAYVRGELPRWLADIAPWPPYQQLMERAVRVEQELVAQRDLIRSRFEASDQRFDEQRQAMDERFAASDHRFDGLLEVIETRFAAADHRFDDLRQNMNARFAAADHRFEDLRQNMDARFAAADRRFEDMYRRLGGMQWLIGIGFVVLTTVMSLYQFLA